MAPKAPGRTSRSRSTRARGGGRGGKISEAPVVEELTAAASSPESKVEEDKSQSMLSRSPQPIILQTVPKPQIDSMDIDQEVKHEALVDPNPPMDPNTSPASQPTETPAPTPLRPVPEPSSASTPVLGEKIKKESRFKPKNVRTSRSRLEDLAEDERKRKAEAARNAAYAERGARGMDFRGMRGRGRGDVMGRGRGATKAGGIWGIAPEMEKGQAAPGSGKISGINSGGGGGESSRSNKTGKESASKSKGKDGITYLPSEAIRGSRTGGRGEGGASSSNTSATAYEFEPVYPDDDETQRVDITHINDISSDDEPINMGSRGRNWSHGRGLGQSKGGMKPVRLDRVEHKSRKVMVEEEAEDMTLLNEKLKKVKTQGVGLVKLEPGIKTETLPDTLTAPDINTEDPSDHLEVMDIDEAADIDNKSDPTPVKTPRSFELKKKIARLIKKDEAMPTFQSEEDRQEYNRTQQDRAVLAEEIASMYRKPTDGDDALMDVDDRQAGRTFLFQFPPRIPTLYDPIRAERPPLPGALPKFQPDADIQMVGTKTGVKTPIDLTGANKKVSFAPANPPEKLIEVKQEEILEPQLGPSNKEYVNESGLVGRLVLRKSGKFEMKWGGPEGNQFAVHKGVTNSFMSVSAVVEHPDGKAQKPSQNQVIPSPYGFGIVQEEGPKYGTASGMGKVMGKFIVTPDWDTML